MSRILLVDDEPNIVKVLASVLATQGHKTAGAFSGEEALAKLDATPFDLVITDLRLGSGMDGLTFLQEALVRRPRLPVVMISAYGTIELAVEAMKEGAADFIRKPFAMNDLLRTVKAVLQRREEPQVPTGSLAVADELTRHYGLLVGESSEMRRVYDWIERVAKSDATVLIQGESGTGKELVAQAIHRASRRAEGPWVPLNCAALPPTLLESEMFGHAAGAFTGATQRKDGLLIAADRGTLFLDEIGVMELGVQSKLLRALQERKVRRVGETDDVTVDVRVIAATNESLEARKDAGLFREDLFYRISVIPIQLPPLRQRLTDIPLLVRAFCHEQSQTLGLDVTLEQSVWDKLATYSWPGNVRELANAIACAAALCDKGLIRVRDLPPRIARVGDPEFRSLDTLPLAGPPRALRDYLRAKEKEYLEQILRHTDGNRAKAAELLGISRATFYRKLEGEGDPATGAE